MKVSSIFSDNTFKKSSLAIAARPNGINLSLMRLMCLNALICISQQLNKETNQLEFSAPIQEIARMAGASKNSANLINNYFLDFLAITFNWAHILQKMETHANCPLLEKAIIVKESGENIAHWKFSTKIESEILEPVRFALLNINTLQSVKTFSGVVLFEICTIYRDYVKTCEKDWTWWVETLYDKTFPINNLPPYRVFNAVKLKPAINELNLNSDIDINIELGLRTLGRKIKKIRFFMSDREDARPSNVTLLKTSPEISRLRLLGISESTTLKCINKHGVNTCMEAAAKLEKRLASSAPQIRNRNSYFNKLISDVLSTSDSIHNKGFSESYLTGNIYAPAHELKCTEAERTFNSDLISEILALDMAELQALLEKFKALPAAWNRPDKKSSIDRFCKSLLEKKWLSGALGGAFLGFYYKETRNKSWNLDEHTTFADTQSGSANEEFSKPTTSSSSSPTN